MKLRLILCIACLYGCAGWTVNGVNTEKFKHLSASEKAVVAAGIGTSFIVHGASHVIYLESSGIDWHQDGLTERIDQPITDREREMIGRSGMLGQLIVGIGLALSPWSDSLLVTGYHIGTFSQIITSPVFDMGDMDWMGDYAEIEWGAYSMGAAYLMLKK